MDSNIECDVSMLWTKLGQNDHGSLLAEEMFRFFFIKYSVV